MKLLLELSLVTQEVVAPTHMVRTLVTHSNEKESHNAGKGSKGDALLSWLNCGEGQSWHTGALCQRPEDKWLSRPNEWTTYIFFLTDKMDW